MMLRSLMLENFRQFYGVQTIEFAATEDHNVTVVYGANGAGKTALLNAFTWCFYNKTTEGFERPTELVNHRAWAEASQGDSVPARIVVNFEHREPDLYGGADHSRPQRPRWTAGQDSGRRGQSDFHR